MNRNFDIFIKDHLQEVLCEAEKAHALAFLRKDSINAHQGAQLKLQHPLTVPEIPLQDCAASHSLSQSHL